VFRRFEILVKIPQGRLQAAGDAELTENPNQMLADGPLHKIQNDGYFFVLLPLGEQSNDLQFPRTQRIAMLGLTWGRTAALKADPPRPKENRAAPTAGSIAEYRFRRVAHGFHTSILR
jgi:hypothetical protein